MTEAEMARYDAGTLARLEFIVGHNATPQPERDGLSLRDLVFGSREFTYSLREVSTMRDEEQQDSERTQRMSFNRFDGADRRAAGFVFL